MAIDKDTLEEMAWSQADLCQRCRNFVPWRGIGWGCEHPKVEKQLRGEVICGGSYFSPMHIWDSQKY
jgi:hypothetical protein